MTYDEQKAWQKQDREREDLEYERDREREARERTEANEQRLRKEYRQEMASAQEQRENLCEELREANREAWLYRRFLTFKQLHAEFDKWKETDDEEMED
jgi:hypothetical protein